MPGVLLDTGPFVALLDARDPWHEACVSCFAAMDSALLTTEAVLTEALHLLGNGKAQEAAIEFIVRGAADVVPSDRETFRAAQALMRKYSDIPMDYADATLVHLAKQTSIFDVFTLDRRGFLCYRPGRGKHFRLLP